MKLFIFFVLLAYKFDEEWDTDKKWEALFEESDKLLENYNLNHDQDELLSHIGAPGTETDPDYPIYFNRKLNNKRREFIRNKKKAMIK